MRCVICFCLTTALVAAALSAQNLPRLPGGIGGGSRGTPKTAGSAGSGGGGRVKAELDQAERALDTCGRKIESGQAAQCGPYHAKFDDSIGDAKRALGSSASAGGAAELLLRLKDLEQRKAQQEAAIQQAGEQSQATAAKFSSAEAEKDKVTIEALRSFYQEFHHIAGAPDDLSVIASWPRTKKDVEALMQKYPMVKSRQGIATEAHDMVNKVRALHDDHRKALLDVDKQMVRIPEVVNQSMTGATERMQKAETEKRYDSALLAQKWMAEAEQRLKVYEIISADHPKRDPQLATTQRAKIAEINAQVDKLAEQIVSENVPPVHDYTGADAAQLKETVRRTWMANFASVRIVDIRLSGQWQRAGGYKWEGREDSWMKFDASRLRAFLIIDAGHGKFFYLRTATLTRDHVQGDRVEATVQRWDPTEKVNPLQTFLKAKVKL
jgi:hypothetical protein